MRRKWNRRQVLGSATMAAWGLSISGCSHVNAGSLASAKSGPKTFLLVHGAWHGGWCWRDVRAQLETQGHKVWTPTLTGLADRAHLLSPAIGLDTHIQDITTLIAFHNLTDIILVGHSYGGMVVTGVADRMKERVSAIVYLDAALPKDGDTMITQGPPRSPEIIQQTQSALANLAPDGIGMAAFAPEFLGIPKDHPSYSWVAANLTPHPLKTWLDPIKLQSGGSIGLPRTYVHCTSPVLPNSSFPYHAAKAASDPSWTYRPLRTGHDAMITAPEAVARILMASK
ncbi:MAG: alpha/beta hydrolase [Parasphingorhabdus sp.]|uniref:alpha/beta fold hydrolase n=1 Tax=Parasphingorhabdus sp. TaxID=2709688 RepID=UPI00329A4F2D